MIDSKDRRVRKTRKALRHGLIKLMKKKSINEITVKELTELVDINRATFYNHYKDIYHLLECIEKEMFRDFEETLSRHSLQDSGTAKPYRTGRRPLPLFMEIFKFLDKNSEMCLFLLSDKGDNEFIEKLVASGKNKYISEWQKIYKVDDPELLAETYAFISAGCIGVIRYWLSTKSSKTPTEMAAFTEKLIMQATKVLAK